MSKFTTEAEWRDLIGQQESLHLEFKRWPFDNIDKAVAEISEAISAFANTEGGHILLGIIEVKDPKTKARVASGFTLLDETELPPERLSDKLNSALHPQLSGIRVIRVRFSSGAEAGKVGYTISVPKGNTAYQAKDKLYYGRTEYGDQALMDHDIRVRMMCGRLAQAQLVACNFSSLSAATDLAERVKHFTERPAAIERRIRAIVNEIDAIQVDEDRLRAVNEEDDDDFVFRRKRMIELESEKGRLVKEDEDRPIDPPAEVTRRRDYDEYCFSLQVVNTGELTIRDFMLNVRFRMPFPVLSREATGFGWHEVTEGCSFRYVAAQPPRTTTGRTPPDKKLFPDQRINFPEGRWCVRVPVGTPVDSSQWLMMWEIFLDDAPHCDGTINLSEMFLQQQSQLSEQGLENE